MSLNPSQHKVKVKRNPPLTTREKAQKWINHCTGSDRAFGLGVFVNERGAGRLEDMALRCFVRRRRGLMMPGVGESVMSAASADVSAADAATADTASVDIPAADSSISNPPVSEAPAAESHISGSALSGLGDLEWGIGERVLGFLVRNNFLSVALWKHFAIAYSDECPWTGDIYIPVPISEPDVLFDLIPGAIGSPRGLFWTMLTLVSKASASFGMEEPSMDLSRAQWVQLTDLDNLAILRIHGAFGGSLVDQVVRAWAHRSVVDGAFSRLRMLVLADQDTLTMASLLELTKIKSLAVVSWSGRAITRKSVKAVGNYGWKLAKEEENCYKAVPESPKRPLLAIRYGPRPPPERNFTARLIRDPEWKPPTKRLVGDQEIDASKPAPPKRPNMRKGARKDATALLNQFSGV